MPIRCGLSEDSNVTGALCMETSGGEAPQSLQVGVVSPFTPHWVGGKHDLLLNGTIERRGMLWSSASGRRKRMSISTPRWQIKSTCPLKRKSETSSGKPGTWTAPLLRPLSWCGQSGLPICREYPRKAARPRMDARMTTAQTRDEQPATNSPRPPTSPRGDLHSLARGRPQVFETPQRALDTRRARRLG